MIAPKTGRILYWVPVSDPLLVRMEAFPTSETDTIQGRHRRVAEGAATVRFPFKPGAILFWAAPDLPPRPVYEGAVYVLGKTPADPVGLAFRGVSRRKGKSP